MKTIAYRTAIVRDVVHLDMDEKMPAYYVPALNFYFFMDERCLTINRGCPDGLDAANCEARPYVRKCDIPPGRYTACSDDKPCYTCDLARACWVYDAREGPTLMPDVAEALKAVLAAEEHLDAVYTTCMALLKDFRVDH
jgi:hypothetical protein